MGTSLEDIIKSRVKQLADAGVGSARLDCLILLEDIIGKDRAWLLAHPEYELTDIALNDLDAKLAKRLTHMPLAYIRGKVEFYGRTFVVDEHVLVPRPESETIIQLLLSLDLPDKPTVVDVGTGSGALAISAKLELPQAIVLATDIDPACLVLAGRNAEQLQAEVSFSQMDLLADIASPPDVILANLPYVPDELPINQAAGHEPALALFSGPDGLDLYRRMFEQLNHLGSWPAYIITEALPSQHVALAAIARGKGYDLQTVADFIQVFSR